MKTRQDNAYGLALPASNTDAVKQMVWGPDWREREARSAYLRRLIGQQARDPQAGKPQRSSVS